MKRLLVLIAALAALVVVAFVGAGVWLYSDAETSTVGELNFENELDIPPLLEPRTDDAGRKVFDLDLLQHEDRGMMGQFVVVEPGQQPEAPHQGHDH